MKNVLAKVPISKIVNLDTLLVAIKNNEDDLQIIVTNYKKKIYAYLNSCPHDTRPLCKDAEYLWTKKNNYNVCTIKLYLIRKMVYASKDHARVITY